MLPGLLRGEELVTDYRSNKIAGTGFFSQAPKPVVEALDGPAPTPEFVMGRVYEQANQLVNSWSEHSMDSGQGLQVKFHELGCDGTRP